jgi:hypothetical protein
MIFTARQLQALHSGNGGNGQLVLPYRARLTPLAQDWIKQRKIVLGYSDVEVDPKSLASSNRDASAGATATSLASSREDAKPQAGGGTLVWWCDGPCGPAKAALLTQARESNHVTTEIGVDAKRIVEAVRVLASEIKTGRAAAGVMFVHSGATAMVLANRCPSLRAVLGTCLDAVEQGIKSIAANVLVIEHPYKTLPQVKTMLAKFLRTRQTLDHEIARQLQELGTCG